MMRLTGYSLPFDGVHRIWPQVTLDVMSNSPFVYKQMQGNLEGESNS